MDPTTPLNRWAIVDDNVQPAEMRMSLCDGVFNLIGVGHVQRQRQNRFAVSFRKIGNSRQCAGGSNNFIASLERSLCPYATESEPAS
jgi:hypothetical protein